MARSRPAPSVSRRTALAGLGAGGLGLTLAAHRSIASAQDATPAGAELSREDHLLVGAWEVETGDGKPTTGAEWVLFDPNGTYVHYAWYGVAIGAWRPTGERTAEFVEIYAAYSEQLPRTGSGARLLDLLDLSQPVPADALVQPDRRFRGTVEVDASGNRLTNAGNLVDEEGQDDPTGAGTYTAVRLVAAMSPEATPAA